MEVVRKFAPDGIEMVMDAIGGKSFARELQMPGTDRAAGGVRFFRGGRAGRKREVRCAGLRALLQTPRFHPLKLMAQNISMIGVNLGRMPARGALLRGELDEIFKMYTAGKVKPMIGKTFPLAEAASAHQYIHDAEEHRQGDLDGEVSGAGSFWRGSGSGRWRCSRSRRRGRSGRFRE